ncbi:hypothetical protein KKF05_05860 [Patescibacteria group bacterium]|nr:hypothetical protein [Patescibacteria group bacterium]MBU1028683.1 hypothetical protein [Patescibacteria group bacterium]MBU1916415.1 hypothetical protein [Patescibacteria group bacterium]
MGFLARYQATCIGQASLERSVRQELDSIIRQLDVRERQPAAQAVRKILSQSSCDIEHWSDITDFFWDEAGRVRSETALLLAFLINYRQQNQT